MTTLSSESKTPTIKPKVIEFKDHPEFKPNLTPRQMFQVGSFGGTYWRPIESCITHKKYKKCIDTPKIESS